MLSLLPTEQKAVARQGILYSEHALLTLWLLQVHQGFPQKSRKVFYFLSVFVTKAMQSNISSILELRKYKARV